MSSSEQKNINYLRQASAELMAAEEYCLQMADKLRRTPKYRYEGKFYALRSKAEKEKEKAMNDAIDKARTEYEEADAYRKKVLAYVLKLKADIPELADRVCWFDCPFEAENTSIRDGNDEHYYFEDGMFMEMNPLCYQSIPGTPDVAQEFAYSEKDHVSYYTMHGLQTYAYIEERNWLYRNDELLSRNPGAGIKVNTLYLIRLQNKSISFQTVNLDGVVHRSNEWASATQRALQKRAAHLEQVERRIGERITGVDFSADSMLALGIISLDTYGDWEYEKSLDLAKLKKKYREERNADLQEYMQRYAQFFSQTQSAYTRTHLSRGAAAAIGYINNQLAFIELYPDIPLEEMDIPADTPLSELGKERYNHSVSKHYTGVDQGPVLVHLARYYGPLMGRFDPLTPKPVKWLSDRQWRLYCMKRMELQMTLDEL